jgi:hypothetical protein
MNKLLYYVLMALLGLAGSYVQAADGDISKEDFSGFLESYSGLELDKEKNSYRWADRDAISAYRKIYLEPIVVYPGDQVNVDIAIKATQHLARGVQAILVERGLYADKSGAGVLSLRAAITGTSKQKVGMKARNFIPVALVFKAGQAATGNLPAYIEVSMEAELTDSETGKRLFATVQRGVADTEKTSSDEFSYDDVIPVLDKWLTNFESSVDTIFAMPAE